MNYYQIAIEKNQVIDFFRGKGEYFDLDRDRGIHDFGFTAMHVIGYGTEFGENKLYPQLSSDLLAYISQDDFSFADLTNVLSIFWYYFIYRKEEKLLKSDWSVSDQLIKSIRVKMELFRSQGEDFATVDRIIKNIKERFNSDLFEE